MSLYDHFQDFGTLVYTVGDGVDKRSTHGINDLSRQNVLRAATIARETKDALLFIAGGNGGTEHGRNKKTLLKGSLPEANRMLQCLAEEPTLRSVPVITDCDPEFKAMFKLDPSHNTPENGRNAAAVFDVGGMKHGEVVAERIHLNRVLATLLHALRKRYINTTTLTLHTHPTDGTFEMTTEQWHIRNKTVFRAWNAVGWLEHFVRNKVDRNEVLHEFLTMRNFSQYRKR